MIGLVTLGHSPREDHKEVYDCVCPDVITDLQGALDGLSCEEARNLEDKSGVSPLVCLLKDGSTVEIPLPVLTPLIEKTIVKLVQAGATVAVVLCSGGFPELTSSIPVLIPGNIVPAIAKASYPSGTIGIVVPNKAQESAAVAHWAKIGVDVVSAVVSPYQGTGFEEASVFFKEAGCSVVAIDCMGFTEEHRQRLIKDCKCTVLLPKTMVAKVAGEIAESAQK